MPKRRLDRKKIGLGGTIPYVVSVAIVTIVLSGFYFAGWFSLSPNDVRGEASAGKQSVSISDARHACINGESGLVKLCGKIIRHEEECCDFYLGDDSGEILVQTDALLPCKKNRKVIIYGRIIKRGLEYVITGARIEFH